MQNTEKRYIIVYVACASLSTVCGQNTNIARTPFICELHVVFPPSFGAGIPEP